MMRPGHLWVLCALALCACVVEQPAEELQQVCSVGVNLDVDVYVPAQSVDFIIGLHIEAFDAGSDHRQQRRVRGTTGLCGVCGVVELAGCVKSPDAAARA
jgi:hypothetical protein